MTGLEREIEQANARKAREIPTSFETDRLLLRAACVSDAEATFTAALASADELSRWMPWAYPAPTREAIERYHATLDEKWRARETLDFQWLDKRSGALIGKGGFHHIDWQVPKFEIGYWLHAEQCGQGYCTEAVLGMLDFAKTSLQARRLEIRTDPNNHASRAVAERCGLTLEGILRTSMRGPDGSLRDACVYALIVA